MLYASAYVIHFRSCCRSFSTRKEIPISSPQLQIKGTPVVIHETPVFWDPHYSRIYQNLVVVQSWQSVVTQHPSNLIPPFSLSCRPYI